MGIYDRDYYRQNPNFLSNYFADRGAVCKLLIVINVAFFLLQVATARSEASVTQLFCLDVEKVWSGEVWRLLTYAFLHDPRIIGHILFNMLFLWWFGSDVEDIYGPREFAAFYLVAALLGGITFSLIHFSTGGICLGASGAVTAVLVLCALHYPRRIILLFFVIPVPIWMFVLFSVASDLFKFLGPVEGNVAVDVHLAGAAFGYLYWKFHWRLTGWINDAIRWQKSKHRPRLKVYREEEEPEKVPSVSINKAVFQKPTLLEEDDQLEDELDAVLEKLSLVGKDNLTESEKQLLLRASEKFRNRRK